MHAERIELTDPRLRTVPGRLHLPWGPGDPTVTVSKDELSRLWTELHDPQDHFCERPVGANPRIDKVREWICGAQKDPRRPRDLHVDAWLELLKKL
jgi:hypothetical protein